MTMITNNHTSVDCVVFAFDGQDLNVLLLKRNGIEAGEMFHDMKLPGALIYSDENLDIAAKRILKDTTGLDDLQMMQFRAYGSAHRLDNPKDTHWLQNVMKMEINRIITVAYMAFIRFDEKIENSLKGTEAMMVKLSELPSLAFDHNQIITDVRTFLSKWALLDESLLFSMLPKKFTILQYRLLLQAVTNKNIDNANIYKKIAQKPYIVPLDEKEQGLNHRAARYYSFDLNAWEAFNK